jgi:PAS domain S-box-containing protein
MDLHGIVAQQSDFVQMVNGVQDYGILLLDPTGHVMSWNAGAARIEGYDAEEIIGQHFSRFYTAEAVARGWPDYELKVANEQGRFEDEGWRVRKDGSHFWANVVITPWLGKSGDLQGYLKITRDLTARKQAEEQLADLAQRLQRSNRELEEFASVAAHDLQEPLRKIEAFSVRLQTKAKSLDDENRDYLQRIVRSVGRMRDLINDLLMFSRVSTKARPFVPVSLDEIAQAVVSDLEGRIQQTGGRVELQQLPSLEADPMQIRQLLTNLIANALKFRRPGEPPVVRVGAEQNESESTVMLTVSDNGIGFEQIYLDRIFEVFQRLHGRQEYEGTGMGLAICRKIVVRHGGTITAESEPGKGSTFIVTLPRQHREEENAA